MSFTTQRTKREPLTLEQFAFLQLVDRSAPSLEPEWVKLSETWVAHLNKMDIPKELYTLWVYQGETYIQINGIATAILKYAPRQQQA